MAMTFLSSSSLVPPKKFIEAEMRWVSYKASCGPRILLTPYGPGPCDEADRESNEQVV